MRTIAIPSHVLAILSALAAGPAAAKDDPLEFLHLLQREGYADVAIDYLDRIKTDPNAPKEVMEVWDLEMSRSKSEVAKQPTARPRPRYTEEAKALLERFIKANPNRPEAIQEAARVGGGTGHGGPVRRAAAQRTRPTRRKRPSSWPMPARSSRKSGRGS